MAISFITGSITVDGATCASATVTCPSLSLSCLDGTYIGGTTRTGSHAITAHAPGCKPVTKKVTLGKATAKPKVVDFALKPRPASRR